MRFARGITVVRHRPGGRDKYGDPVSPTVPDLSISGVGVAPRSAGGATGDIDDVGRTGVVVGLTLYFPEQTDVTHGDQILIPSPHPYAGRWDIDGEPAVWTSPISGWAAGMTVTVKRGAG